MYCEVTVKLRGGESLMANGRGMTHGLDAAIECLDRLDVDSSWHHHSDHRALA